MPRLRAADLRLSALAWAAGLVGLAICLAIGLAIGLGSGLGLGIASDIASGVASAVAPAVAPSLGHGDDGGRARAPVVHAQPRATPCAARPALEGACVAVRDPSLSYDGPLRPGIEVELRHDLRARCAGLRVPVHGVLVADAAAAAGPGGLQALRRAGETALQAMGAGGSRLTGVVVADEGRVLACELDRDLDASRACLSRLRPAAGPTDLEAALAEAARLLGRARREACPPNDLAQPLIVLLSDGGAEAGCPALRRAAGGALGPQDALVAACVGPGCDEGCLRQLATSPRLFAAAGRLRRLEEAIDEVAPGVMMLEPRAIHLEVDIPPGAELVPGSALPAPIGGGAPGGPLRWSAGAVDALRVRYRLRLPAPGRYVVGAGRGEIRLSASERLAFDEIGRALIVPGTPSATPDLPTGTATRSGPLDTPRPTARRSPTATATPSPTAEGGRGHRIFLPRMRRMVFDAP